MILLQCAVLTCIHVVAEPPPTSAYGMTAPGLSYPQMVPQGAPPSYAESLSHPVVAGHPGMPPQFPSPYHMTPSAAAASAAHLQNYKVCDMIFYRNRCSHV